MPNGAAVASLLPPSLSWPRSTERTHYTLHKWLVDGRLDGWMVVKFLPLDPSANKATPPSSAHDNFHGLAIWAAAAANTLAYARSACPENVRVEEARRLVARMIVWLNHSAGTSMGQAMK